MHTVDCTFVSIRKMCKKSALETRSGRRLYICTASHLTEDSIRHSTSWHDSIEIEKSIRTEAVTETQIVNNRDG